MNDTECDNYSISVPEIINLLFKSSFKVYGNQKDSKTVKLWLIGEG